MRKVSISKSAARREKRKAAAAAAEAGMEEQTQKTGAPRVTPAKKGGSDPKRRGGKANR